MTQPYTKLPHSIIRNPSLSYGATGLLALMHSMAPGWKFTLQDLSRRKKDKRFSTRQLLKELESIGAVQRLRITDDKGRVKEWKFQLNPESNFLILDGKSKSKVHRANNKHVMIENPESNFPDVEKSRSGKPDAKYYQEERRINKKEFIKNDNNYSGKGVSENTRKILESYEAYFGKSPKGESVWIDYFEGNKSITPVIAETAFETISQDRMRHEEHSGFKNHTPPTLPQVKKEIERLVKAMLRPEPSSKTDTSQKTQESPEPVLYPVQHSKPQSEAITPEDGAAGVFQALGIKKPKSKKLGTCK